MKNHTDKRLSLDFLKKAKSNNQKITMLTAYDALTASIFDAAGIDGLLVGDSIGNVYLGYENTLPVTLEDIITSTKAVARATNHCFIVADLPFGTYEQSPEQALESAVKLMKAGANAVKLEGGVRVAPQIKKLTTYGIPVFAHIGFTPQSENIFGGKKIQGKTNEAGEDLANDAKTVEEAGACAIVLELIPASLTTWIQELVSIPTIGIGAGKHADGQILVWTDMAGMPKWSPKFAKQYGELGLQLKKLTIDYIEEVHSGIFPSDEHSY